MAELDISWCKMLDMKHEMEEENPSMSDPNFVRHSTSLNAQYYSNDDTDSAELHDFIAKYLLASVSQQNGTLEPEWNQKAAQYIL